MEPVFDRFLDSFRKRGATHSHSPWSAEWTSRHFDEALSQSKWSGREQASSYLQSISASQRTSCLSSCWWWVSPLEHRWEGWSLSSKRANHGDDKVLPNCLLQKKDPKRPGITASTVHKAERGIQAIVWVVKKMSQVISQEKISLLTDEYQAQVIPESWYGEAGSYKYLQIEQYYNPAQTDESFSVPCPWPCWSWAFPLNKQEIVNNERTLLSDETNN